MEEKRCDRDEGNPDGKEAAHKDAMDKEEEEADEFLKLIRSPGLVCRNYFILTFRLIPCLDAIFVLCCYTLQIFTL